MVLFSEMFASELIGDPVVDCLQENIGRVKDILVSLDEINQTCVPFPKVIGILVKISGEKKNGKNSEGVLLIEEIDLIGRQFISTRSAKNRLVWTTPREKDALLLRDIMDQQVVDLDGARVIRVNDVKLAKVNQDVRLIAADVGWKGMLRRLGMEKLASRFFGLFQIKVPEQLIGWDHIQSLIEGKLCIPVKSVNQLHPADVAQIISQVKSDDKAAIFSTLSDKTAAEALHELEPMLAAVMIANLDTKKALGILEKMPVDEVADILGDLAPEKTGELLRLMKVRKSTQIEGLLKHKDETAGGLMTTEFITLPNNLTVEQTIARLRETAPDAETIYYLYVVDETEKIVGIVSLRSLIVAAPEKPIAEIMLKDFVSAPPTASQREVASIISKYNLLALPIVDENKKILGIVTVDDVIDFILPPFSRRKRQMLG